MAQSRQHFVSRFAFGLFFSEARAQGADNHLAHCSTQSTSGPLLAVMSDVVQEHVCHRLVPPVDFDNMLERCDAFCAPKGIPILVGTDSAGFNLDDINFVCLGSRPQPSGGPSTLEQDLDLSEDNGTDTNCTGSCDTRTPSLDPIMRYDEELMQNCERWGRSIDNINIKASEFIGSVRAMTMEQLVYRATMRQKVADLQRDMNSDAVQLELDLARINEKMQVLRRVLNSNMQDLMTNGALQRGLAERIQDLESKSTELQRTILEELPMLENYVEQCNELLVGTGPQHEQVLDICSVTSDACVEEAQGHHAGCCCGIVPSVGSYSVSAAGQRANSSQRLDTVVNGSRRLQIPEPAMDVCGHAYEVSRADVESTVERLNGIAGGDQVLDDFERQQRESYPEFYSSCRRLREHATKDGDVGKFFEADGASRGTAGHEQNPTRRSQSVDASYLECEPPSSPTDDSITDPLRVAFWQETESALCKDLHERGAPISNERLGDLCAEFCAPHSVPLLLGTTSFGFSHEQMDEVCLAPDSSSSISYGADRIGECHAKASAFVELQEVAAAFAAALQVLDASKLRFEAHTQSSVDQLKFIIRSEAEATLDNAAQSQKIDALLGLIRRGLSDILSNSNVTQVLKEDAEMVRLRARELQTKLAEVLPQMQSFLSECNFLTTGSGPSQEYLLDLCSQTSTQCIDGPEGLHVGCCCGYNPVVTLGMAGIAPENPSIDGLQRPAFEGSRSRTGRRLQVGATSVNICAEAAQASSDSVRTHRQEVKRLGQEHLTRDADADKMSRYPSYYDRCHTSLSGDYVGIVADSAAPAFLQGTTVLAVAAVLVLQ